MSTSQPLKKKEDIKKLEDYFYQRKEYRNYLLVVMGLNTALRISDLLQIKWTDVYNKETKQFLTHVCLTEQKTGKHNMILLNPTVKKALKKYGRHISNKTISPYIFFSPQKPEQPLSRVQAYRIIQRATKALDMDGQISCHSLRKTFGYQAWKEGTEPALLMSVFNHSSYSITKRYLCIDQDDKDELFLKISL